MKRRMVKSSLLLNSSFIVFALCFVQGCRLALGEEDEVSTSWSQLRRNHNSLIAESGPQKEMVEWKEIEEGESVPPGSHVRIDMSGSGKKYLKVDSISHEGRLTSKLGIAEVELNTTEDFKRIESVLLGLPQPHPDLKRASNLKVSNASAYKKIVFDVWKQRQEELAKAIEELADETKIMKNDVMILVESNSTTSSLLKSLENLEWMVQDLDKARDFVSIGGLEAVTLRLSHSSSKVRAYAAYVIGSACKLDVPMQDRAREIGTLASVLKLLKLSCRPLAGEDSFECAKVLYAISSLLRGNLQNHQELSGTSFAGTLLKLLDQPLEGYQANIKVKTKVVALIEDILVEGCGSDAEASSNTVILKMKDLDGSLEGIHEDKEDYCYLPLIEEFDLRRICTLVEMQMAQSQKIIQENRRSYNQLDLLLEKLQSLKGAAGCARIS